MFLGAGAGDGSRKKFPEQEPPHTIATIHIL